MTRFASFVLFFGAAALTAAACASSSDGGGGGGFIGTSGGGRDGGGGGGGDDGATSDDAGSGGNGDDSFLDASPNPTGDGGGGGTTCSGDTYENNDSFGSPAHLAAITDCDSTGSSLTSVISGSSDVDYYAYSGTDTTGCVVDPSAQVDTDGLEVCVIASCKSGIIALAGCSAGSPASSLPSNMAGCCAQGTIEVKPDVSCSGSDDSMDILMRVREPSGSSTQ